MVRGCQTSQGRAKQLFGTKRWPIGVEGGGLIIECCLLGASSWVGRRGCWRGGGRGERALRTERKAEDNPVLPALHHCSKHPRESITVANTRGNYEEKVFLTGICGPSAPWLLSFRKRQPMMVRSVRWNKATHLMARTQKREERVLFPTIPLQTACSHDPRRLTRPCLLKDPQPSNITMTGRNPLVRGPLRDI